MPNPIKYSTGSESLALKTGDFYIATGDVAKGPTSTTGYYNGITPPVGGYTIYLNKATGGPSIYVANNDSELINLTNKIAGTTYTTANECLVYFAGQNDKMVLNRDYENIITDGLVLNLDAGFTASYPKNGTSWFNLSLAENSDEATLDNGATFSSADGGSIVFDGVDDYVDATEFVIPSQISVSVWVNPDRISSIMQLVSSDNAPVRNWQFRIDADDKVRAIVFHTSGNNNVQATTTDTLTTGNWTMLTFTVDGTNLKIYFNAGVEKASASFPYSILGNGSAGDLLLAARGSSSVTDFLNGNISIVIIYDRALTSSEIAQNYNSQKGRFGL